MFLCIPGDRTTSKSEGVARVGAAGIKTISKGGISEPIKNSRTRMRVSKNIRTGTRDISKNSFDSDMMDGKRA